jgi:hypothetical protein
VRTIIFRRYLELGSMGARLKTLTGAYRKEIPHHGRAAALDSDLHLDCTTWSRAV